MITIKDIAKLANVSDGTVDRVIHNRKGVSPKTAEKVKNILKENNFLLNPIASALATKNKYRIACLIPKSDKKNQFWKSPNLGILKAEKEVTRYGLQIDIAHFDQYDSKSYLEKFKKLQKNKPDAFIIAPMFSHETAFIAKELEANSIKYIFINIDNKKYKNIAFIGQDSQRAGYVAGKLMSLGLPKNSKCGVVQFRKSLIDHKAISNRISGFNNYLKKYRTDIKTKLIKISLNNKKNDLTKIKSFLNSAKNVSGIFVPSSRASYIASLLPKYVNTSNFSLIGYDTTEDNIFYLKNDKIQFIISQRSFNQGYEAVHIISDFLIQKKVPQKKTYSPIQIIIKENAYDDSRNKKTFINELSNQ